MPDSKLKTYAENIVQLEKNINTLILSLAEDSRTLINQAYVLSGRLQESADQAIEEITKMVDESDKREIETIRKEFDRKKQEKLSQIKRSAEKNLDKAAEELLLRLKEAFK